MPVDQIEQLRKVKEAHGLSYDELGHEIGVHSMSVYRWLKQGRPPKSRALRRAVDQFLKERSTEPRRKGTSGKETPLATGEAVVTV